MTNDSAAPDQHQSPGIDENFHFLAYPANLLVWVSNREGLCSFVSPSWTRFTGRDLSQELGTGWLDRVHPEDRDGLVRGLDNGRRCKAGNQQPFRLMFRYLREDGVYRWLMSEGMPHSTPTEKFVGYLSLCFDVTPYQEGEAEMERSVQNVFPLLKQTRLIAVILDNHGRVQFSNGGLCRLLKCSGPELLNCNLFERYLAANDRGLLERLYPNDTQNALFPSEFQSELLTGEKQSSHISWHSVIWREYSGRIKGSILIGDDITALRHAEEETTLYTKAFEATDHAIVVTTATGSIVSVNRAFTCLTGYSRKEALGTNPRILQSGRHDERFYTEMWAVLRATGHWHGDIWDKRKDGSIYPKYLSISAIKNPDEELTHYVGIFYDNSERKTVEERLDHLAHYDALTGIPNRSLLLDRFEQAMERARRLRSKVALLYLDLDHFKLVNDTHGHSAGDALLKSVAQRMKTCVRAVDTIARLGGDEFVVLVPDIEGLDDIRTVASKLLDALTPPYEIEGHSTVSTPSIGISIYPDDGEDVDLLMKRADAAMYQAKQSGRGDFRFFREMAPPAGTPD
jgi:diguanylate cyclase (GGDEF)-like protein/PAS domain S-box-containing protein